MRFILLLLPAVLLAQAPAPKPMSEDDKTVYALGLSISRSLSQFDLSPAELELVKQAITDSAAKKPAVDIESTAEDRSLRQFPFGPSCRTREAGVLSLSHQGRN